MPRRSDDRGRGMTQIAHHRPKHDESLFFGFHRMIFGEMKIGMSHTHS